MVDNVHRGGMGAVALERMIADGIDIEELKSRNEATKGIVYPISWFQSQITQYQQILEKESG